MNREILCSPSRSLTLRERMWIENFHTGETPASLKLADDYIKLLRPSNEILDVGCAFGRVDNFLVNKKGVVVTGVDINSAEIDYANKKSTNSQVNFRVMDGTELEFSENSFDSVIMVGIIGGVEPEIRKGLLREAYRVVKSGGTVAIAEFKINLGDPVRVKKYERDIAITGEWGSKIIRRGGKILFIGKHFTKKELIELLSNAGFSSIQSRKQFVETAGIGDGIVEKRQQYTVWGVKPLG